jgi:hypothetical protein
MDFKAKKCGSDKQQTYNSLRRADGQTTKRGSSLVQTVPWPQSPNIRITRLSAKDFISEYVTQFYVLQ